MLVFNHSLSNMAIWRSFQWCRRLQNSPIFAYSNTREQSNKRSGTKLKNESETGERRACEARAFRETLTPRFTDFFTDFEKKNRLFCSSVVSTDFP